MAPEIPGYELKEVNDTEDACTTLAFATVVLAADDVTLAGIVDDVLLPAAFFGDTVCAVEQFSEMVIADWAGACDDGNWVWATYEPKMWVPTMPPFVIRSRLGGFVMHSRLRN